MTVSFPSTKKYFVRLWFVVVCHSLSLPQVEGLPTTSDGGRASGSSRARRHHQPQPARRLLEKQARSRLPPPLPHLEHARARRVVEGGGEGGGDEEGAGLELERGT